MTSILFLLMLALLVLMVVGMFKPAIVLPKFLANKALPSFLLTRLQHATDNPTRGQVLKWYWIAFLIVGIIFSKLDENSSFDQQQAKKLIGKWVCEGPSYQMYVTFNEDGAYTYFQPGDPTNSDPISRYGMTLHGTYSHKDDGIYVVSNYWEAPQQDQYLASQGLPLISGRAFKDYFMKIKTIMNTKLVFDMESRKKDGARTFNNHIFNCARMSAN